MQDRKPKTTLLDPPYDGYAVWHEHAFRPDDLNWDCRYDAVEDRTGRIFVWHVGSQKPVCICADHEMAITIARSLAREVSRAKAT
jgi:hypothetical protein